PLLSTLPCGPEAACACAFHPSLQHSLPGRPGPKTSFRSPRTLRYHAALVLPHAPQPSVFHLRGKSRPLHVPAPPLHPADSSAFRLTCPPCGAPLRLPPLQRQEDATLLLLHPRRAPFRQPPGPTRFFPPWSGSRRPSPRSLPRKRRDGHLACLTLPSSSRSTMRSLGPPDPSGFSARLRNSVRPGEPSPSTNWARPVAEPSSLSPSRLILLSS